MLQTAEKVAERYHIFASSDRMNMACKARNAAAAAAAAGKFNDEIVPITVSMAVADKEESRIYTKGSTLTTDEGIRADTTTPGVAAIKPALPGGVIAAGNASQFSDGAAPWSL